MTGVDAVAVGWFAAGTDLNFVDSGGFEHNGCYIEQFKNIQSVALIRSKKT